MLVDSDTASGAELAARYLQLSGKAVILGDLTSGMVNEGHLIPEKIGAGFVMPFATMSGISPFLAKHRDYTH